MIRMQVASRNINKRTYYLPDFFPTEKSGGYQSIDTKLRVEAEKNMSKFIYESKIVAI